MLEGVSLFLYSFYHLLKLFGWFCHIFPKLNQGMSNFFKMSHSKRNLPEIWISGEDDDTPISPPSFEASASTSNTKGMGIPKLCPQIEQVRVYRYYDNPFTF
jgi:hypothetical protein